MAGRRPKELEDNDDDLPSTQHGDDDLLMTHCTAAAAYRNENHHPCARPHRSPLFRRSAIQAERGGQKTTEAERGGQNTAEAERGGQKTTKAERRGKSSIFPK